MQPEAHFTQNEPVRPHDQAHQQLRPSAQPDSPMRSRIRTTRRRTSRDRTTRRTGDFARLRNQARGFARAWPPADPPLVAASTLARRGKVTVMEQHSPDMERRVEKRRAREKKTISQMIAMHCAGTHRAAERTEQAFCGDAVCPACAKLDAYAVLRTERCRKMHVKTSCEACENHCYAPEMRESIRAAMRYSGPRMIFKHPVAAIRHLLGH